MRRGFRFVEKQFRDEPAELRIGSAALCRIFPRRVRGNADPLRLRSGQALGFAPNEQTIPPASFLLEWHGRLRFAVSHISRKTREIWGTLD